MVTLSLTAAGSAVQLMLSLLLAVCILTVQPASGFGTVSFGRSSCHSWSSKTPARSCFDNGARTITNTPHTTEGHSLLFFPSTSSSSSSSSSISSLQSSPLDDFFGNIFGNKEDKDDGKQKQNNNGNEKKAKESNKPINDESNNNDNEEVVDDEMTMSVSSFQQELANRGGKEAVDDDTEDDLINEEEEEIGEFDGYDLRDAILEKWGECFDVEFQRVDSYGFQSVYLNIMPFRLGGRRFRHETEFDYLCHLQAVVEILVKYDQLGYVLAQLIETNKKPRAGTSPLVAVPLRLDLTPDQVEKILG